MEGRAGIVTGASRGIGLAIARVLLEQGARGCITGRNEEALAGSLLALGHAERVMFCAGNVGDPEHRRELAERVAETFGRIDFLVNNAGINPLFGPLVHADLGAARKIYEVNVLGPLGLTQEVYAASMRANGGAIVNVASIVGLRPARNLGAYAASKAALIHMTRQLALELGPSIRVNAIAPAVVETDFAARLVAYARADAAKAYPLGRVGRPEDVAGTAAFLLSESANWISGETITVDGGLMSAGGIES